MSTYACETGTGLVRTRLNTPASTEVGLCRFPFSSNGFLALLALGSFFSAALLFCCWYRLLLLKP